MYQKKLSPPWKLRCEMVVMLSPTQVAFIVVNPDLDPVGPDVGAGAGVGAPGSGSMFDCEDVVYPLI